MGVSPNWPMVWRWAAKLAVWVLFVLALALVRPSLKATWEEIAWLIGPAIVFVGLLMLGSLGLAWLKVLLGFTDGASSGRRPLPTSAAPRLPLDPST